MITFACSKGGWRPGIGADPDRSVSATTGPEPTAPDGKEVVTVCCW